MSRAPVGRGAVAADPPIVLDFELVGGGGLVDEHVEDVPSDDDDGRSSVAALSSVSETATEDLDMTDTEDDDDSPEMEEFRAFGTERRSAAWIYDEPPSSRQTLTLMRPEDGSYKRTLPEYCTLNRLILLLTVPGHGPQVETYFLGTFLCTYRNFASPALVLQKLLQRYTIPPPDGVDASTLSHWLFHVRLPTQRSVCRILFTWLHEYPGDFGPSMAARLADFATETLPKDGHHAIAVRLRTMLDDALENGRNPAGGPSPFLSRRGSAINLLSAPRGSVSGSGDAGKIGRPYMRQHRQSVFPSPNASNVRARHASVLTGQGGNEAHAPPRSLSILAHPEHEVALQLTEIQATDYNLITPKELLIAGRANKAERHLQQYVTRQMSRFNNVSNWVSACVVFTPELADRVQTITRFVAIMDRLYHLNNFNGMAAVYGGLNASAVHRLSDTFAELTPPVRRRLDEITRIMDSASNYKSLRNRMSKAVGPCLPYLGVFLHDLVVTMEAAPTFTDDGLINYHKSVLLYNIMYEVLKHRSREYKIQRNATIQMMLVNHEFIPEDKMYDHSLKVQPRKKR